MAPAISAINGSAASSDASLPPRRSPSQPSRSRSRARRVERERHPQIVMRVVRDFMRDDERTLIVAPVLHESAATKTRRADPPPATSAVRLPWRRPAARQCTQSARARVATGRRGAPPAPAASVGRAPDRLARTSRGPRCMTTTRIPPRTRRLASTTTSPGEPARRLDGGVAAASPSAAPRAWLQSPSRTSMSRTSSCAGIRRGFPRTVTRSAGSAASSHRARRAVRQERQRRRQTDDDGRRTRRRDRLSPRGQARACGCQCEHGQQRAAGQLPRRDAHGASSR